MQLSILGFEDYIYDTETQSISYKYSKKGASLKPYKGRVTLYKLNPNSKKIVPNYKMLKSLTWDDSSEFVSFRK